MIHIEELIRIAIKDLPFFELKKQPVTKGTQLTISGTYNEKQAAELKERFNIELLDHMYNALAEQAVQALTKHLKELFTDATSVAEPLLYTITGGKNTAILSQKIETKMYPVDSSRLRISPTLVYKDSVIFTDATIDWEDYRAFTFSTAPVILFTVKEIREDTLIMVKLDVEVNQNFVPYYCKITDENENSKF